VSRKSDLFARIQRDVIIGVVREESADSARAVADAYLSSGIVHLEVTLTTPDAIDILESLAAEHSGRGIVFAAGSLRSAEDAAAARRAGAQILVAPHSDIRLIEYAMEHDLLCVAGAATPTEIVNAWNLGADIVKVYPARLLGGPEYFKTIRQPLRDVPMLAGGPVAIEEIELYLEAGAIAVNLGASLALPELVREQRWNDIGKRAALAVSMVQARNRSLGSVIPAAVH